MSYNLSLDQPFITTVIERNLSKEPEQRHEELSSMVVKILDSMKEEDRTDQAMLETIGSNLWIGLRKYQDGKTMNEDQRHCIENVTNFLYEKGKISFGISGNLMWYGTSGLAKASGWFSKNSEDSWYSYRAGRLIGYFESIERAEKIEMGHKGLLH